MLVKGPRPVGLNEGEFSGMRSGGTSDLTNNRHMAIGAASPDQDIPGSRESLPYRNALPSRKMSIDFPEVTRVGGGR
jgi:hypothetical protein